MKLSPRTLSLLAATAVIGSGVAVITATQNDQNKDKNESWIVSELHWLGIKLGIIKPPPCGMCGMG